MKMSETPPVRAEKVMKRPSGDQDGLMISASSVNRISRAVLFFSMSRMVSTGRPLVMPLKTNLEPVASQEPAERMNWMLSKWGSTAVEVILRVIRPVSTSARKRSIENRSRVDRKTISFPSGLTDGAML